MSMKKEEIEKLAEKYFSGDTDLLEEAQLFKEENHTKTVFSLWARFVKSQRQSVPPSIQEDIWAHIEMRAKRKKRRLFGVALAAASIVIFMLSNLDLPQKQEMEYSEKVAMLEEALSLFPEEASLEPDILYEDEMVMIYTSLE